MPRPKHPHNVPPVASAPRSLDPAENAIRSIIDNVGVGGLLQIIVCECWLRCRDILTTPGSSVSDSPFDSVTAGKWVDLARLFESCRSHDAVLFIDRGLVADGD